MTNRQPRGMASTLERLSVLGWSETLGKDHVREGVAVSGTGIIYEGMSERMRAWGGSLNQSS